MIDLREPTRTYDLTTPGGALTAIGQAALLVGLLVAGLWHLPKPWAVVLSIVAGAALIFFVTPMWWAWVLRINAETLRLENEAITVTEKIRLAEIALDREKQRGENLGILSRMNNEQLQFALELERGELFDVGGNRVTWTVGGTVMPVTFSLDWLEKWEAKLAIESDELPSQHDWDKEQRRELCRDYNAAINNTLVKLGYAQQFGSRYTWRWLYTNRQARWNGLKYIGLDLALAISRGILDIENGDENGQDNT